jgi:hypothetical protein
MATHRAKRKVEFQFLMFVPEKFKDVSPFPVHFSSFFNGDPGQNRRSEDPRRRPDILSGFSHDCVMSNLAELKLLISALINLEINSVELPFLLEKSTRPPL